MLTCIIQGESECLELRYPMAIISIFGSRILKIYFLDILVSTGHILRTLFKGGEGSCLDDA